MSLIGIDMGGSSVKVAAYTEDGKLLSIDSNSITSLHPEPGFWEVNPHDVWRATEAGIQKVIRSAAVKKDPPKAIAMSVSGRENFPANLHGDPLGNGIMGADIRGAEFEIPPAGSPVPEPWTLSCGHLRERMDPVLRLAWWRKNKPEIMAKAKYFLGWHDFLIQRMTGRIVTDQSSASRYLVFDLNTLDWDPSRVSEHEIHPDWLPEVQPWGTVIGNILPELATKWGLPPNVVIAQGCQDLSCAALGAGAYKSGTVCLVSGSYENAVVPTASPPTPSMLLKGLSVVPQPCEPGYAVFAIHPTGNAVMNWARALLSTSIEDAEQALQEASTGPSPIMAIPYLSGSMAYWEEGRKAKGGLIGLTLATSNIDILKALMESIAYDMVNTLSLMNEEQIPMHETRIVGGGARSEWWTQLKADLTNRPFETVEHQEPGTLGAALLAGYAIGVFDSLGEVSRSLSGTGKVYEPDPDRAELHRERHEAYNQLMKLMLDRVF